MLRPFSVLKKEKENSCFSFFYGENVNVFYMFI